MNMVWKDHDVTSPPRLLLYSTSSLSSRGKAEAHFFCHVCAVYLKTPLYDRFLRDNGPGNSGQQQEPLIKNTSRK